MASAASSSSVPFSKKPYHVFISFRGEDTRRNFTAHLHAALSGKQIQTWKDNINLEKGAEVLSAIVDAIDNSYLCIVVFSKEYASSTWCLRELTHIVETKKDTEVIIPVFYQINPSDVRKQTGNYETAFQKHREDPELEKEAKEWRASLLKASNCCGFDSESKEYR